MTLFFTSDTHFNDPRVLRIDRRPFPTLAAHDAGLVERWNEVVRVDDTVWHLGDFARGDAARIGSLLDGLNGRKHLIVGNNDGPEALRAQGWASVQHYGEMTLDGRLVILCHYPFRTWNRMGQGSIDLHGHSHGKLKPAPRQFDIGVDAWDFRPVTLDQVLARRGRRAEARAAHP
jgi:calcineurin-like phosphoesterase family protein